MLKILKNPDTDTYNEVKKLVSANDGYCPCRLEHSANTKCPCKEFRDQTAEGECHCGLYVKKEV